MTETPPQDGPRRTFWSTRIVARRLKVSEATVKRWSDDGLLACYRTPGGHRKFSPTDVAAFIATNRFDPERGAGAQAGRSEDALALMAAADINGLFLLGRRLLGNGVPLENVLDEVYARALVEIGERWACGTLGVAEEHASTSATISCLSRLEPMVSSPSLTGSAVAACLAGERHDVATRMAGLLLQSRGYRTAVAGADTPIDSLLQLVRGRNATILAVSASSAVLTPEVLQTQLKELLTGLAGLKVRIFAGGSAFSGSVALPPQIIRVANMRAFVGALPQH